jgi:hypothetical protein
MATTRGATVHWKGSFLKGTRHVTHDSSGLGAFDVTRASGRRAVRPNCRGREGRFFRCNALAGTKITLDAPLLGA